jgi:uncharacterized protein YcbX
MHVSGLRVYPVKSMAGLDLDAADVHPWGLEHDRRWMVVDETGTTITARETRRMLHIRPTPQPQGALLLEAPGCEPLAVDRPDGAAGERVAVELSRVGWASAAGAAADEWLSRWLGEPARLVWLDDPGRRTVSDKHGGEPGDLLSFADAGPILVTTTSSLAQLNDWIVALAHDRGEPVREPLSMVRFRPNLVVDGVGEPFAEDDWKRLRVGDVDLRIAEHCDRCALPTIDPASLRSSKEPTRTLARHRQWDHKVHFGVRVIPGDHGVVRLGDPVSLA